MVVTQRAKKNSRQRAALRATCCVVYTQKGGRGRGGRGEERRRCATGDESVPIVARKLVPQPILLCKEGFWLPWVLRVLVWHSCTKSDGLRRQKLVVLVHCAHHWRRRVSVAAAAAAAVLVRRVQVRQW